MEDTSDIAPLATSTPTEAAQNISNGNLFSVDPRYAAQNKDSFNQKATQLLQPTQAEPPVAAYQRQSSEHAALASPDVPKLNFMARQAKMIGDYVFDRPSTQQQIVDLNLKKMNQGGQLSGDDDIKLQLANHDAQDLQNRDYGISGPIEKIPAMIAGTVSDFGQSLVRGARKGVMEGPFKSLIGNAAYGTAVKEPFDNLTAGTYNELGNITDDHGNPKNLDHDTKLNISRGVGVVGTALMNAGGLAIAETMPFLKPLMNPVLAAGIVNTPAKAAILASIGGLMKGSAAVAGVSGLTEFTRIVGEEIAKAHGTDEAGFWNGLATAAQKVKDNQQGAGGRVLGAAGQGALAGAAMELPLQIAGFGRTKQNFEQAFNRYVDNLPPSRDVTPEPQQQLEGTVKTPESVIDITPPELPPGDPAEKAFKALQLNEALHQINDVQKSTGMESIAPGELTEVNKQAFLAAGLGKLYTNRQALNVFASSEEKGRIARGFIDPTGNFDAQIGASIAVDTHKVMEVAKQYPDVLDHFSHEPDAPNGTMAKEYVEALNRGEEKRAEVMQKLGIKPEEVKPAGGGTVSELQVPEKAPAPNYDFEAAARRTGGILAEIKDLKDKMAETEARHEEEKNITRHYFKQPPSKRNLSTEGPDASVTELPTKASEVVANPEDLSNALDDDNHKVRPAKIAKLEKELEKLKSEVAGHLKESPPGKLLIYPFDEAKSATQAELKFGREPTFTDALRSVLPETQVAKFNDAVLSARQHTVNLVHDQAVHEMNKVVDQTAQMAKEDQFRAELERIANDPNYALVDKFRQHQVANAKGKAKFSIYAIDPTTLPDDLLHYTDNPRLKEHKVFAKGANSADDSARALGFQSPKELLDVLKSTPTRQEMVKARAKFYDSEIEKMARESVDLDHTSIGKAFTDKTKAYLETMRFLKDNDWSQTKFGVKKIALPLPRIEEIENDSQEAVKKMTVGELKPSKYVMGEKQSYREAVDKFLAGDLAGAFRAKEMTARNAAMQKHVRIAIGQINSFQKFARRLEDPSAVEVFRRAGKLYENARDEILDVYNFNPRKKDQSEKDSYAKWVRREVDNGRGDFSIPDRLSDIRQSIDQMTVEQVLAAGNKLRGLYQEARHKFELLENKELRDEERSVERIENDVVKELSTHPGNDKWNIPDPTGNERNFKFIHQRMQSVELTFSNMENVIRYFDRGQHGGFFQALLFHQLKGDGKFLDKEGYSWVNTEHRQMAKDLKAIWKNHGSMDKIEKKLIEIPELKGYPALNDGNLTKGDLIQAWKYKGDPGGRAHLQSGYRNAEGKGIMLDTWQKIFDRELTEADVTAAQYEVDMPKKYWERTRELQIKRKGEEPIPIKGVPNEHQGKFYPGGYVHLNLQRDYTAISAMTALQNLEGKDAAWFSKNGLKNLSKQPAGEQTQQGRLTERVDHSLPLDLSYIRGLRAHEEILHDLGYYEGTANALQLLRNPKIKAAMIQAGGQARYDYLINGFIEVATRSQVTNANFFSDQTRFLKNLAGRFQSNFTAGVLGLSASTGFVQFEELSQLAINMGPKGQAQIAKTMAFLTSHPHLWPAFVQEAIRLDPSIGSSVEHIQNQVMSTIFKMAPQKEKIKFISALGAANDWVVNKTMLPISGAEIIDKVIGSVAAYRHFMAGGADNWPLEKVQALNPEEQREQATAYVRQISRLSFMHTQPEDRSVFQKYPGTQMFAFFWNYFRNVLNNQISELRQAKWEGKAGNRFLGQRGGAAPFQGGGGKPPPRDGVETRYEEGGKEEPSEDLKNAFGSFATAAGSMAFLILINTVGRWYAAKVRGEEDTPDQWDWKKMKDAKGRKELMTKTGEYMMSSPVEQFLTAAPTIRDIFHAEEQPDRVIRGYVEEDKNVNLPITRAMSDVATGIHIFKLGIQQAENLNDFVYYLGHLDNKQTATLLRDSSYIFPWPVNAYSKLMRTLERPLNEPSSVPMAIYDKLNNNLGHVLKRSASEGIDHLDLSPDSVGQLEKIKLQIQPEVSHNFAAESEKIKSAMSGGDWSKPDGIYGFTKDKWDMVKLAAPDLGLTDAGRISKNTEQQEKAMDFLLHYNKDKLDQLEVPVNSETLYGSYLFGAKEMAELWKAPKTEKTKSVLSDDALKDNPQFENLKTIGQVRSKLSDDMKKKTTPPTAQLTEPTQTGEDNL